MAQKKSYSRYFIILQEDEKGYSLASDKIASGYAKLETKNDKCKVSYYVQNLKKDKTPYYMILICNKNDAKKIINIGEMNIDDYGRADVSYEYPVNNVSGSGIGIDKVSGAAIVRFLDGNIIAVMSGFASMDIPDWQSFDVSENKNKKAEEQKPNPVKQSDKKIDDKSENKPKNKDKSDAKKEVEKPKDVKKDNDTKNDKDTKKKTVKDNKKAEKKDNQKDKAKLSNNKSIFDEYEENIELKKKEINLEKDNIKDDKQKQRFNKEASLSNKISDLVEDGKKEKLEEIKNINEDESNDDKIYIDNSAVEVSENDCRGNNKKSKQDFFSVLVKGFKEVSDVTKELKRCKWYKVPVTSINSLQNTRDRNKYTFVYCPMMPYYKYIEENCHILFGYKYDKNENVKYMIYGIPGTKSREDQPYGGRSGFVTWVPCRGKAKSGYWIMFYDFKTGTIQIPIKKK